MDIRECTVPTIRSRSPPPSYTEANQCPVYATEPPSTPPPTYREAVAASNDAAVSPFPVLNIPTEIIIQHAHQVIVQQPSEVAPPQAVASQPQVRHRLGDKPTVTICKYCHYRITTTVNYKPGVSAWGMCCLFSLLGLICGCCLIPFCVTTFQDAHHTCPQCNKLLGIYIR